MVVHTDDELKLASRYLSYHVKMLVETWLGLEQNPSQGGWETMRNAILEDHLVHARVLIDFLSTVRPGARGDDVVAIDYFHDNPTAFRRLDEPFLDDEAGRIGGWLVHITKKPMPQLKSAQSWPVDLISLALVPKIQDFMNAVPEERLEIGVLAECLIQLARVSPLKPSISLSAST
jgi:hypothetical protein